MTLILTNTEVSDFQTCRRKWYLGTYMKLGPKDEPRFNTAASIGHAYHEALAAFYAAGSHEHPANFAQRYYSQQVVELAEKYGEVEATIYVDALEKERDLVVTMCEGYVDWLEDTGADSDLEVLGSETMVEVPLTTSGDITLRGKIDAPARWKHSPELLLQLEHKTAGDLTSIPRFAQTNPQFLTYDLLAFLRERYLGEGRRTDGLIINMARKVKRTARAKPPFYGRHEVRHNTDELRAHWKHMVGVGREILRTRERLDAGEDPHIVVPPRPTRDCSWSCPFANPCLTGMIDDGSDFEGFAAANYVERDPLERYQKVDT